MALFEDEYHDLISFCCLPHFSLFRVVAAAISGILCANPEIVSLDLVSEMIDFLMRFLGEK